MPFGIGTDRTGDRVLSATNDDDSKAGVYNMRVTCSDNAAGH